MLELAAFMKKPYICFWWDLIQYCFEQVFWTVHFYDKNCTFVTQVSCGIIEFVSLYENYRSAIWFWGGTIQFLQI